MHDEPSLQSNDERICGICFAQSICKKIIGSQAKMGICHFHSKQIAKCPVLKLSSKINLFRNTILKESSFTEKLYLMKIELLAKC